MLSWNSSVNLKIIGAEGHNNDTLREAVGRGAKFVIYSYNFSLVVMSFKRPSNIYFIPPGQNRIVKGLPFTLISLAFGWWGIPWGIIYTFQSLYQNLAGGRDVTSDLLAALTPKTASPEAPNSPPPVPPRKEPISPRRLATVAGVVAALVAVVYSAICFFEGQNLRLALVSGIEAPYEIQLNGKTYRLATSSPTLVSVSQGDFILTGAPGTKEPIRFSVHTDFFSRPFDQHVLVVNPDRLAIVYRETVHYHPTDSPRNADERAAVDYFVNQPWYYLPAGDYFFENFPEKVSMPTGSTDLAKSRFTVAPLLPLETVLNLFEQNLKYDALRDQLAIRATQQPNSELLQRWIHGKLKPQDARRILESRLDDRPVLVEWHRSYQFFMDSEYRDVDLVSKYRAWMDADPENGSLIYLYARLLVDPAVAHPLYEKARHAKSSTPYAAYALAVDAYSSGDYLTSWDLLQQAEREGMVSVTLEMRKLDTLFALGRPDQALNEISKRRAKDKKDVRLFADELLLKTSIAPDRVAGQRAIATFVSALKTEFSGSDFSTLENYLGASLAYAVGDEREFAGLTEKLGGPNNLFEAAISRRDYQAAAQAVAKEERLPARYHLLLMLAAHAAGDAATEELHFQHALSALEKADSYSRTIVTHIKGGLDTDHREILRTPNYGDELRVLFTALGVHFPKYAKTYFDRAEQLDRDPHFPHLLLSSIRKASDASTKS